MQAYLVNIEYCGHYSSCFPSDPDNPYSGRIYAETRAPLVSVAPGSHAYRSSALITSNKQKPKNK